MKVNLLAANTASDMPQDEKVPVQAGPVDHSRLEPDDSNGHIVTTHHMSHKGNPGTYPAPIVRAFGGKSGAKADHLLAAVNHMWKMHGGKGKLAVDSDKDGA